MKNFEYWEKELREIAEDNGRPSHISLVGGKPIACSKVECRNCDRYTNCTEKGLIKWLYAEHIEQPKINKRTKMFFDAIEKTGWVARDRSGGLYYYAKKPTKGNRDWFIEADIMSYFSLRTLLFLTLDFIKWEDEEPWSVEDIRKLEVEE